MSAWKKLVTAVRGHANDAAEAVADKNAITILEQEMRDTKDELRKSDHALTSIMAKRKLQEKKVKDLQADVTKYEDAARKAATAENMGLARECAERVAELRNKLTTEDTLLKNFASSEGVLKTNIKKAKSQQQLMEQQIDTIKATASVQKAQAAVSSSFSGANSNMKTAADSLSRIQAKQAQNAAELESAEELASAENGDDLEAALSAAGITGGAASADDELARILGK